MHFVYLTTMDPSIGKIDKSHLSQQTLMELLVEKITGERVDICGDEDDILPLSEWQGLTLNDEHMVTEIDWSEYDLDGPLAFPWIPETVERLNLESTSLEGTLNCSSLPARLTHLYLADNVNGHLQTIQEVVFIKWENLSLQSSIDLQWLPQSSIYVNLEKNRLFGSVDTEQLPNGLVSMWLAENAFSAYQ